MSLEVWGMVCAGVAALCAGLVLARPRFQAARGAGKIIVLGPVFEAGALAIFAAEHFLAARELKGIVPRWLPWHQFWTYFFGVALLAAVISFILWRCVRWSATLLAFFFLLIVVTLDVPGIPALPHDRFFWILTVRETCFGAGAMVLAGSMWQGRAGNALRVAGRAIVAPILVFYAIEHFLHPHHVPGVPLEKLTPAWVPAPVLLSYIVGGVLLLAGAQLLIRRTVRSAAANAGSVLLVLTAFFYLPIFLMEMHSPLAVEGMNYVGDTLLFAATALLAGFGPDLSGATAQLAVQPAGDR